MASPIGPRTHRGEGARRPLRPFLLACAIGALLSGCGPSREELQATATSRAREQATEVALEATSVAAPAFATAEALAEGASLIFGPEDLALEHNPNDKQVVTFDIEDELRDVIVEARFTAPYDGAENPWDVGVMIRSNEEDDQIRVAVTSDGEWTSTRAVDGDPPSFRTIQSGVIAGFDGSAGATVSIRLVAQGERGALFINDAFIATLELDAKGTAGTVIVGTGFFTGNEQEGATTLVEGVRVWGIRAP
jgi:hypothetical protein